jgi:hypothetical protein
VDILPLLGQLLCLKCKPLRMCRIQLRHEFNDPNLSLTCLRLGISGHAGGLGGRYRHPHRYFPTAFVASEVSGGSNRAATRRRKTSAGMRERDPMPFQSREERTVAPATTDNGFGREGWPLDGSSIFLSPRWAGRKYEKGALSFRSHSLIFSPLTVFGLGLGSRRLRLF